jgi:GH24 family phage-related lysozyme (muramidase)
MTNYLKLLIHNILAWVAKAPNMPQISINSVLQALKQFEGNEYTPYVPDVGQSGVTVGIGVDLGHMNFTALIQSNTLREKIAPYYGKYRDEAAQFLAQNPLELTKEEVDYLSTIAIESHLDELRTWYNLSALAPFGSLTDNQKIVMMSVKYQYGDIRRRTPKFWGFCVARDWRGAYNELMNFGDAYKTRRRREAALLAKDFT